MARGDEGPDGLQASDGLGVGLDVPVEREQAVGLLVDGLGRGAHPVSRRYKGRDGEWTSSQSFSRNDILLAIHCLDKAAGKIIEEEQVQNGNKVEEEVVM